MPPILPYGVPRVWQQLIRISSRSICKILPRQEDTSLEIRPTVQYFRPGFNRNTLNACGTTILFCLSYGGGIPSNTFNLYRGASPRLVLPGIMPRTAL